MSISGLTVVAYRLTLRGQVQGVGLRPEIARLARALALSGYVRNAASGVEIYLEGDEEQIALFHRRMPGSLPAETRVTNAHCDSCDPSGADGFEILESLTNGPLTTRVPKDRASCDACLDDVSRTGDRRAGYAFTSCTECGPRYSLIEAMPYDRCRTSMKEFELCPRCREEYRSADDRRFHAQTNACSNCGPKLWIAPQLSESGSALADAAAAVLAGKILALRGLGGYQLVVDASNAKAVDRLRKRKRRLVKPLAVMVRSLSDADQLAVVTERERSVLNSAERPIVLVRTRASNVLCEEIHPGLREVGLFLPTTPLHWLLLDLVNRPLVVTSGNIEGEPLATEPRNAERDLKDIADLWLHHDRKILRPIDDSVVRVICDQPVTIRNARGLAPLPLQSLELFAMRTAGLSDKPASVLAVGGHQKNAVALFNGTQAILGPHIGDLESLAARQRFVEQVDQLQTLYGCQPRVVVHDMHPDYFTTRWAESSGWTTLAVQHHHAHVVSAMIDNDWLDCEVLGVAFDGTGYGTDGTIWGGEFLRANIRHFERVALLRPFRLPGGESAVREPWRVATSLLMDTVGHEAARRVLEKGGIDHAAITAMFTLAENPRFSPFTSSAGRLFDGVAALILGLSHAAYEGHPAMLLESAADGLVTDGYEFTVTESSPAELDWRPMIRQLLADCEQGLSVATMAAKFHRGLAQGIAMVCRRFDLPIVLTGGVFQNRLLTELVVDELIGSGHQLGRHSSIPPNDGGLAAGQLAIALARLTSNEPRELPTSQGAL